MRQKPGFGRGEKIAERLNRYMGRYVILYVQGSGHQFTGRLNLVENGDAILNPFLITDYSEGKPIKKLSLEDSIVRSSDIYAVEPVTEKDLEAFCIYQNSKLDKDSKK
jgi:hypothetical protein